MVLQLDDKTINITSSSLRAALSLSAADRRWIDVLVQSVSESWDECSSNGYLFYLVGVRANVFKRIPPGPKLWDSQVAKTISGSNSRNTYSLWYRPSSITYF